MPLVFPDPPFVKTLSVTKYKDFIVVCLQGHDTKAEEYVECRVSSVALTQRYGAEGLTDLALLRAFEEHRGAIETVARRKYEAGKFERGLDHIIISVS